jgi:hypothetical protein
MMRVIGRMTEEPSRRLATLQTWPFAPRGFAEKRPLD